MRPALERGSEFGPGGQRQATACLSTSVEIALRIEMGTDHGIKGNSVGLTRLSSPVSATESIPKDTRERPCAFARVRDDGVRDLVRAEVNAPERHARVVPFQEDGVFA